MYRSGAVTRLQDIFKKQFTCVDIKPGKHTVVWFVKYFRYSYSLQWERSAIIIQPLSALRACLNDNVNSTIITGNPVSNISTMVVSWSLASLVGVKQFD